MAMLLLYISARIPILLTLQIASKKVRMALIGLHMAANAHTCLKGSPLAKQENPERSA